MRIAKAVIRCNVAIILPLVFVMDCIATIAITIAMVLPFCTILPYRHEQRISLTLYH